MYISKEKTYCIFCGTRRKGTRSVCGYNEKTGIPNYRWTYRCPNKKCFMFWYEAYKSQFDSYFRIP